MKNNINFKSFYVMPKVPENLKKLVELSENIWSTWDSNAWMLFSRIDPLKFRQCNHNFVKLLQNVSSERLEELSHSNGFLNELNNVYEDFQNYLNYRSYYYDKHDFKDDFEIAYFSMEYGLHESVPIYSGGLGILSGDHLKAASDLGLPLTGFGLLYKYGYFSQKISLSGRQEETYIENEWYLEPVKKVLDNNGNELILQINIADKVIYLKAWKIMVGKIPLYLLDTNFSLNDEYFRKITDYLYVSDREMRLLQEIVLAFGSIELMKKLNLNPTVFHLNEGHSAFLIIKRLQHLVNEMGFSYSEAKKLVKLSTVFTTHTPVPAGNEKFDINLVRRYLEKEINSFGESFDNFLGLAMMPGEDKFSLPALAIRFSKYINGVSKLHSIVSKEMWHPIYPNIYEDEMPIQAITNGVHVQTWTSHQITRLLDRYMGMDYLHKADKESVWKNILAIPENEIWLSHQQRKEQMISFIRNNLEKSMIYNGIRLTSKKSIRSILRTDHLLIGFARRFATYKRANLIIKDKERLLSILNDKERPVQFIFAGKAHPADERGKDMIQEIIDFARENDVLDKFVFVENYDINIARHMIQGVDVWLNNPIKPMEASGTSGMKAGLNGVLNFSVLDGWWPECYNGKNGWAIDAGENVSDPEERDTLEANQIYDIIESQITKIYYNRDQNGVPRDWVDMMKHSIYTVGKDFNMHRMLRQYTEMFYIPAFENIENISRNDYEILKKLEVFETTINDNWDDIRIEEFVTEIESKSLIESGNNILVKAKVYLSNAKADDFSVEFFYKYNDEDYEIIPLEVKEIQDKIAIYESKLTLKCSGQQLYNLRIKPKKCCFRDYHEYVKWFY